jgi:hypothetical protein
MKSLIMKSLFEKFSKVKLGPVGNIERPLPDPLSKDAIAYSEEPAEALCYIETCNIPLFMGFVDSGKSWALQVQRWWSCSSV